MRCLLSVGMPVGALVLAVIVLVVAIGPAAGQPRSVGVVPAAATERRVALVIGNDAYQQVEKLEHAASDARAVGAELGRLGFEVLSNANLDRRGMNQALRSFVDQVGGGGVGVLFFAGHGVQVGGVNYLLPVDIQATRADDLADEALDLGIVMERLAIARAKFVLLIIDACRDNPFPKVAGRGVGASRGLTIPSAPDALMVVYSAGINERALDKLSASDTDANGLFTREFLKQLRVPGVRVDEMVRRVRGAVREQALKVRHVQNPAIYDQSSGDFFFSLLAPEGSTAERAPGVDPMTIELAFWDSIKSSSDPEDFRAYLSQFPGGRFAALARNRLAAMGSSSAPPPRSTPPPRAPEPTQVAVVPPPPAALGMDGKLLFAWHRYGGGKELLQRVYAASGANVVSLLYGPMPTQPLGWFKRPITKPESFKDLKYRTVSIAIDVFQSMGAAVNALPGGEIVPAMDRGLLDGAEFNNMTSDRILGLAEVSKICMMQSYHQNAEQFEILINKSKFDALPAKLRAILEYAADAASTDLEAKAVERYSRDYVELQTKDKVRFFKTPDSVLQKQLESFDEVVAKKAATNPLFKEILESQRAFAARAVKWDLDNTVSRRMAYNHYFARRPGS